MEAKQTRVRWNDDELSRLADVMAPRLLADPGLHPLDAVRVAQECLEPDRRRELKAWSLVEGRLQPRLDEALARLRAQPSTAPVAEAGGPHADGPIPSCNALDLGTGAAPRSFDEAVIEEHGGEGTVAAGQGAEPSGQEADLFGDRGVPRGEAGAGTSGADHEAATATPARVSAGFTPPAAVAPPAAAPDEPAQRTASVALDPAAIEAALLAALQSPAVEEALVELFSRTMAKALLRTGTGEPRPLPGQPSRPPGARRVLLAGFPEAQQQALMEALGARFEVRSWKPVHGPQTFQALARLCRTVVFPEDADDEVDAGLRDMDVRVIRHAGNASRLIERIAEPG